MTHIQYALPEHPVARRAIQSVMHGWQIACTAADWPVVRVALLEHRDQFAYAGQPSMSLFIDAEVDRLDALFTDPAAVSLGNTFIIPRRD